MIKLLIQLRNKSKNQMDNLDQAQSILPSVDCSPLTVHAAVEGEQFQCRQNGSTLI